MTPVIQQDVNILLFVNKGLRVPVLEFFFPLTLC